MKQRFSSLDVKVISQELSNALCSLRLANIYDLSSRIFLLKFAKPDQRQSLVIDTGFRCHLTSFTRATATAPSAFVARLRKCLRTRRVTAISQVGTDRIIEIQFSDGQYRLFLEFYASGNLILTDKEFSILGVFRLVNDGPEHERARVGLNYPLENRQNYRGVPPVTRERVRAGLQASVDGVNGSSIGKSKRPKKNAEGILRRALATSLNEFPPMLIEHALSAAAFDPAFSIDHILKDDAVLTQLVVALDEARKTIDNITSSLPCPGYIIAISRDSATLEQSQGSKDGAAEKRKLLYDDFHPFMPCQVQNNPRLAVLDFKSFNETVDEFFSSVESQKLESRLTEREENARKRLILAKQDHEKRLGGLQTIQELNVRKAQAIEANLERVQEVIAAVNSLVAKGIDWTEINRLIEMEQGRHNVVAKTIKLPLKLYENTATLLLSEEAISDDEDIGGGETGSDASDIEDENANAAHPEVKSGDDRLVVDVDLALSPWSNARQYYEQRKSAVVKEQKTLQSSEKALQNTQKKINADLKRGLKQEKETMRTQRKALWFEKFVYFISSEGYLCLSGKDAQQDEVLYKRYLEKGDVYVHADVQSATAVVVKNKPGKSGDPIPLGTLSQAGTLAVSTSSAWDSKAIFPAWWVSAEQVSKITSSGDYLQTGNFQINGDKIYLPPAQLLLGFGVVFRIDEDSKARHLRHRVQEGEATDNKQAGQSLVDETLEEASPGSSEKEETDALNQSMDPGIEDSIKSADDVAEIESDQGYDHNSSIESEVEHDNPLQPNRHTEDPSQLKAKSHSSDSLCELTTPEVDTENSNGLDADVESLSVSNSSVSNSTAPQFLHLEPLQDKPSLASSGDFAQEEISDGALQDAADLSAPTASDQSALSSQITSGRSRPAQIRGKRGKNKTKTKYAEQDDEDRALAMRILGSGVAPQKAQEETIKASKARELHLQTERRRKQYAIEAERGRNTEKSRRSNFQTGISALEEGELEVLKDLDALVGAPEVGDEILDAFVMCGPWAAISRCSWRVKLQPGTVKKGKAVREILQKWTGMISDREQKKRAGAGEGNELMMEEEKVRCREGELIRALRETEVVGVVPVGKVRIVLGPGEGGAKGGRGGGGAGRGKRGGRGSKKQR